MSGKNTKKRIAEKQWRILEYFIIEESKKIEMYLISKKRNHKEEISHFKTYPGKIGRSMEDMTRVTANKACELFTDMGILEELEKEPGEHLKGGDVTPYSLKSDVNSFRVLIKLILEGSFEKVYMDNILPYPEAMNLLDNYYFTYNINDSFIKDVLAEKGVTITRYFSTMDFDQKSAQRLIDLDDRNYRTSESKTNVTEIMKSMMNKSEEEAKKTEHSRINNLAGFCTGFLEMVNDSTNPIESGLQDYENWAFRLIEQFDNYHLYRTLHFDSPIENIRLELPVFCDDISNIEKINRIKEDNFTVFYDLLYGTGLILFSSVVMGILNDNEQILEELRKIEYFLELSNNCLSDDHSAAMNEFEDKWKEQINTNRDEYNPIHSANMLEDLKNVYSNLPGKLEKLMEKHDRNYDLESMIRDINYTYERMEKEVLRHSSIKDLKNEFVENNFDTVLNDHYRKFEYEKVIIPILSLIHASPLALNEFLNGKWESFNSSFSKREEFEHNQFFTKLIHIVSINLLLYPKVLKNGIVKYAGMESIKYPDHHQMIPMYKSNIDIQDYNQFNDILTNDWYNGMDFTEFKSNQPTFLKIKLKQLYEIRYKLSFLAEYNVDSSTVIDSRAELKMNSELELLKVGHIKDPIAIISKLKLDTGKFAYIRNMFSTQMQNKILFINIDEKPSMSFVKELLGELNSAIMDPEFYEDGLFDDVLPEKEGNKLALKTHIDQKLSTTEIMRMVNEEPLYHRWFLGDNRYLLERSFENGIESGCSWTNEPSYSEFFEKHLDRCAEFDKRRAEFKERNT